MHANKGLHSIESIAGELSQCVHLGLIDHIGVCNYNLEEVVRMDKALRSFGTRLTSNQVELSLIRQLPIRNGLKKGMDDLGITLLACEFSQPVLFLGMGHG